MTRQRLYAGLLIGVYALCMEFVRRVLVPLLAGVSTRKGWAFDKRATLPRPIRACKNRTIVWIHAASLGEVKLLFKFLDVLEEKNPDDRYVLTATSSSGVGCLQSMQRPSICAIGYLPFDTVALMKSLLTTFRVSRLWLLETELWPAMLWACKKGKIPVGIANARMENRSFVNYRRYAPLFRELFAGFDVVMAQNEAYADRFSALGVQEKNIHIVGNIKGQIQIKRPPRDERMQLRERLGLLETDFVVTVGCLRLGEGTVIRAFLQSLHKKQKPCKCIVVPRHLKDSTALTLELGAATLRLTDTVTREPWDVCIVEKFGILEPMYKIADAAIGGGTFVDVGGHNMWESARFGIPVFFGPDYHTQISSCEKLMAAGVGFKVSSGEELANKMVQVVFDDRDTFNAAVALFAESINRCQSVLEPLIP